MASTSRDTSPPSYTPTHPSTKMMPSPPRTIVPYPEISRTGLPNFPIGDGVDFDFTLSPFTNSEFLNAVTYGNFMTPSSRITWKYEQRRTAQRVLPFLYLGPFTILKDSKFLQAEGITMVMAVRNIMSAQAKLLGSTAAANLGIQTVSIDVAGNQELIAAFPCAIDAINLHLSTIYKERQDMESAGQETVQSMAKATSGKVLVFCESGNERSAAVVVAYIMAMYSVDLINAIHLLQTQRFCASFDDNLKDTLQTFDSILCARRDVSRSGTQMKESGLLPRQGRSVTTTSTSGIKVNKRRLSEAGDTNVGIEIGLEQMDLDRFHMREGNAPFEDMIID